MKIKVIALAALLALLFACGAPAPQTTEPTTTQATTTEITSTETTTGAPTTSTTAASTTQKQTATTRKATTIAQTTTNPYLAHLDTFREDISRNPKLTPEEKAATLSLLIFESDKNDVWYLERDRDVWLNEQSYIFGYYNPPPIQLVYGTVRVKFQYDDQAWMVQMWKGRYGLVMLGGEIAVLKKPIPQAAEHYLPASPSEELTMSMNIYQHNFLTGKTVHLFTRQTETTWWYNGFVPGAFYEYNKKSEIIMVGSITFPDQEMLRAFEASFAGAGFVKGAPDSRHPETYSVSDNMLTFSWQTIDQDAW